MYSEAGWISLEMPSEYGGQGLPNTIGLMRSEFVATANWTWGMYPGLSAGAMQTILLHGTTEQKQTYLPQMTSGKWSGVMDLTEAQAGTDLNQVKTRAVPQPDGTYRLTGEKIFISCGEHQMAENIIHIVLARLPDAPPGTRGISLFLVPKYQVKADGTLDKSKKNIELGSIEHKMGIHGSSTCVMVLNESVGTLIGKPNKGLKHMFTFMNFARLGTALQGIGTMELAFQNSLPYTRERMSMRALSGTKSADKPGDTIINHPDVRRMLLTQKAFSEGARAMLYETGKLADGMMAAKTEKERDQLEHVMGLQTPILKGFLTELSIECAYYGQQVYGGHGYIVEWGMEQIARDARISTLYEGTTGVQALDLLGRKILTTKPPMGLLLSRAKAILGFCAANATNTEMMPYLTKLSSLATRWVWLTTKLAAKASRDKEIVGAASYDFLMYSGYTTMAYQWARMMEIAFRQVKKSTGDEKDFYQAKIQTGQFYFDYIVPRTRGHSAAMMAGSKAHLQMKEDNFICTLDR
eukprot:NODE_930_length_1756_cov_118.773481_g873_i0.p1 GENE.NODE_930_length_1756_cov_118.773481_g873_i0~~NODE_930_length_1756_cov_118.773481_g873_i0.p1  ORF type:complete len:548 (-),score=96.03 NODE_930_length_1756_cov_118.773481_g873_i0:113-1684(-)